MAEQKVLEMIKSLQARGGDVSTSPTTERITNGDIDNYRGAPLQNSPRTGKLEHFYEPKASRNNSRERSPPPREYFQEMELRLLIQQELGKLGRALGSQIQSCRSEVQSVKADVREILNGASQVRQPVTQPATQAAQEEQAVHHEEEDAEDKELDQLSKAMWAHFEESVQEKDLENNVYFHTMRKQMAKQSELHRLIEKIGYAHHVLHEPPNNCLARATEHTLFQVMQTAFILGNMLILGYEADVSVKAAMKDPPGSRPGWVEGCNKVFSILFTAELLFRIVALRSWFLVSPEWIWNYFDTFVVATSIVSDFILSGVNLSFVRSVRMLRALRTLRIIRVLRFFRRLRQMMFAILASLGSLMWFFFFLGGVMFMFSILLLQGLVFALDDMPIDTNGIYTPEDKEERLQVQKWYGSMSGTMYSLLLAVTGGHEWYHLQEILAPAGTFYEIAFAIYVLFVLIGVINVLTGVFVASAADFQDESLMILNEQTKIENDIRSVMQLFEDADVNKTGRITWPDFNTYMKDERLQAYLSSLDLEPTHARLIFDLLDYQGTGELTIHQLVLGLLRLKGSAKAIDARAIQHQLSLIPKLLHKMHHPKRRKVPSI